MKNIIRHIEASRHIDDTFLNFNPTENSIRRDSNIILNAAITSI